MDDVEDLLRADAKRREAMISGNAHDLARTLDDELQWTHSSGRTDDKKTILTAIESKAVNYRSLHVEDFAISQHGEIFIYQGVLNGRVSKDGIEKELRNKFLSVWERSGSSFQMLAWQSTGF